MPDTTQTDSRALAAWAERVDVPAGLAEIDPSNYDVHGEIARGGMGRILHATDRRLGRDVAIKQLLVTTERHSRLFEREIRISARLQHPAIVNIYEAGHLPSGELFYAMKLVAGKSLAAAIQDTNSLAERIALLPSVIAVCDALAYAHQRRVIHRDLKPSNVLVGDFGETVVIDWGLAKELDRPDDSHLLEDCESVLPEHTVSGRVVGTPAYMAPEQARGEEADERSDVYALGALIYHVLSARPPYRGADAKQILEQVRSGPPPSLEDGVPSDLFTLVTRAMSRKPADRYASAVELVEDLRRFQTGKLVSAHRYSRRELFARWVGRNRAVVVAVATALLVLTAVLVFGVNRILRERDVASSRANRLALSQAGVLLESDPAAAIATLRSLPRDVADWGAARVIAAAARERGIGKILLHQRAAISLIATAPRGKALAIASEDGVVVLLDGLVAKPLWSHAGPVTGLAFDDSGRWLASASRDTKVRVYDFQSRETHTLDAHDQPVVHIAFSGGGEFLASVDSGGHVYVWNTVSRTSQRQEPVRPPVAGIAFLGADLHPTTIAQVSTTTFVRAVFSADGTRIAAATGRSGVDVWTPSGPPVKLAAQAEHLLLSPDGLSLVTSNGVDGAELWNVEAQTSVRLAHSGEVTALSYLGDGELVATGGRDGAIRVWNRDGVMVRELAGHRSAIVTLATSADGNRLLSGSTDRTVRAWQVLPLSPRRLRGHSSGISHIAFGEHGGPLVSAGWDATVRVWDMGSGSSRIVGRHVGAVRALAVKDGAIASGGDDRTVRRWSADGSSERVLGTHLAAVLAVAFSPDGTQIVSGGRDNAVRLWAASGSTSRALFGHSASVDEVAFSPNGRWIASASADGTARAWNLDDGTIHLVAHRDAVKAIAFSPDSTWLASAGLDGAIRVTTLLDGQTTEFEGHTDAVRDLAVSANGRWLASVSDDMTARVWNIRNRTSRVFAGHRDYVTQVRFDKRVFSLITVSEDATLRVWDIDSGTSRVLTAGGWLTDVAISSDGTQLAGCGESEEVFLWSDNLPIDAAALQRWLTNEVSE